MHLFTRCKRDRVYCTTDHSCTFVDRKEQFHCIVYFANILIVYYLELVSEKVYSKTSFLRSLYWAVTSHLTSDNMVTYPTKTHYVYYSFEWSPSFHGQTTTALVEHDGVFTVSDTDS